MANPVYRLLYADGFTNNANTLIAHRLRGELPVISATATETFNTAGRMSVTCALPVDKPGFPNAATRDTLQVGATQVFLERDYEIVWGGFLWTAEANLDNLTLQLECEGFWGWIKEKVLPFNVQSLPVGGVATDVFDYLRDHVWLTSFQSNPPGYQGSYSIGLDTSQNDLGTNIDSNYFWTSADRMSIGEIIEDIASRVGGFCWRVTSYRDGADSEKIKVLLELLPNGGTVLPFTFEVGANCSLMRYREDGKTIINGLYLMGAGGLHVTGANSDMINNTHPVLFKYMNLSDVANGFQLQTLARFEMIRGRAPMATVVLTTFADTSPGINDYRIGDIVRVRSEMGWATFDTSFRIMEKTISISEGAESIQVSLTNVINFTDSAGITISAFY